MIRGIFVMTYLVMIKHILKISLGFILIFIGFIGGLIPIVQGWIFGIMGLIILANYFSPAKRLLNYDKKKVGYKEMKKNKYKK